MTDKELEPDITKLRLFGSHNAVKRSDPVNSIREGDNFLGAD